MTTLLHEACQLQQNSAKACSHDKLAWEYAAEALLQQTSIVLLRSNEH